MPRPKGALNKKGKQSGEERKAQRRATSQNHSEESRQRDYAKRKIDRMNEKLARINSRIKQQRNELYNIARFGGDNDPAFKELGKLLDSTVEKKNRIYI